MRLQIVIDTNVLASALRSRTGSSFKLLSLVGQSRRFEINVSVPLVLEYEDVLKRQMSFNHLTEQDIEDVINSICALAHRRRIHFLWRPFLKDPKDDMVLELAVESDCRYIVTFNLRDFAGVEKFGLIALTPAEFLKITGEI